MAELVQYLRDDIEFVLKGDWHETVNFYEDDEVTPMDTTGYSMTMEIFAASNGEVYDTLTGTNTPASGQFNFDLTASKIEAYEFRQANYRMILDYGDESKQVWRMGRVKVVDS